MACDGAGDDAATALVVIDLDDVHAAVTAAEDAVLETVVASAAEDAAAAHVACAEVLESIVASVAARDDVLIIMRHSVRADKDGAATWEDAEVRPFDPPIVDLELPAAAAAEIEEFGITAITTSPFRRCLQTAGICARHLGIAEAVEHRGLGEVMHQVRKLAPGLSALELLDEAAAKDALWIGLAERLGDEAPRGVDE